MAAQVICRGTHRGLYANFRKHTCDHRRIVGRSLAASMSPAQFLSQYPQNLYDIAGHLRDLVRSTFPAATEKVYTGWKLIGYRLPDGKKGRYFCCIVPQKKENDVLLGFEYGIAMQDPKNQLEGKGTQVRFVRIREKDQYSDSDLIWLIEEAARVALDLRI